MHGIKVAIVIPTFERKAKLARCLEAIKNSTYKNVEVYVFADNNDSDTYQFVHKHYIQENYEYPPINVEINDKREYVLGSWNKFCALYFHRSWQAMLWLVDDTELLPDCIEKAVKCLESTYSDLDGVVGIAQVCPEHDGYTYKEFGQMLIGKKFISRYSDVNYTTCCPDYFHFWQDWELCEYAKSLNKFTFCKEAVLKHYHPAFVRNERDATHEIVRGDLILKDNKMHQERQSLGYLWGKNFNLIRGKR